MQESVVSSLNSFTVRNKALRSAETSERIWSKFSFDNEFLHFDNGGVRDTVYHVPAKCSIDVQFGWELVIHVIHHTALLGANGIHYMPYFLQFCAYICPICI